MEKNNKVLTNFDVNLKQEVTLKLRDFDGSVN